MLYDMDTTQIVGSAIDTGKAIGDVGMMAVTAGFFLVLSGILMVVCFKWFIRLINSMLEDQKRTMEELLKETRNQNSQLAELSECLAPGNQLKTKVISNAFFDLGVEKVCHLIKKVRAENHIVDRQATEKKVYKLLKNLHDDRNTKLDSFTYHGRSLSSYTNEEWIDRVKVVVLEELYNTTGANDERANTNVTAIYDQIKLDFYSNMMQK